MAKAELAVDVTIRRISEVKAEALREAADALYSDHGPDHPLSVATWLRERAEQLWPTGALNDTKETP